MVYARLRGNLPGARPCSCATRAQRRPLDRRNRHPPRHPARLPRQDLPQRPGRRARDLRVATCPLEYSPAVVANYFFLDDGRRVDVEGGRITLFPDGGFNFRDAVHLGSIERQPGGWRMQRSGRDVGLARSRREAVLNLLDDAADDIAAAETTKHEERALHQEAVALVQRFLPGFSSSPEPFGPFLVFTPVQVIELLEAVDELGLDDPLDEEIVGDEHPWRLPSAEALNDLARNTLGVTFEQEPDTITALAAVQLTVDVWRNTYLEELHAGSHPTGGFPDADMMRFNIATTRIVAEHVTTSGIDWSAMRQAIADPARVLPGGRMLSELANDEFDQLAESIEEAIDVRRAFALEHGMAYFLTSLAVLAGISNKNWYGTPWWPDGVDAFFELLATPGSAAWRHDDGSNPEPPSVADRDTLRALLLDEPERLDDEAIYWCLGHGLSFTALSRGYARWRRRRDQSWTDPNPWLGGDETG
jgi:hypothetical protein